MSKRWGTAIALDVLVVLVFATIGRASHDEGITLAGVARTAWPFLAGAAVGWGLVQMAHDDPRALKAGVRVWLLCVVVGMVLRKLSGAGTAASFVVVATVVLGVLVLGWRLVEKVQRVRSVFRR